jgi:hypothetical protein
MSVCRYSLRLEVRAVVATPERTDEPTVEVITRDEVATAVRDALRQLHLSMEELERQARTGRFTSTRARLVWSAIHDFAPSS